MPNLSSKKIEGEFVLSKKHRKDNLIAHDPIKFESQTIGSNLKDPVPVVDNPQETPLPKPVKNNTKYDQDLKDLKERRPHFYSGLLHRPFGVTFENQEENEEIILLIRRHFITNLPWLASSFAFLILPIIITPFLSHFFPSLNISRPTLGVILSFYYIIIFGYVLMNFTIWYFQVALITTRRIVDMNISGILFRQVSETKLDLIQDVSYTQFGGIRSFFDYGNVMVQTAGNVPNCTFDQVPETAHIIHVIGELTDEIEAEEHGNTT